jgi:hypothetical protein
MTQIIGRHLLDMDLPDGDVARKFDAFPVLFGLERVVEVDDDVVRAILQKRLPAQPEMEQDGAKCV